jgi:cytochrome c-type biogenesis protein CcmH/NrfG
MSGTLSWSDLLFWSRKEFSAARDLLEDAVKRKPDAVYLWVMLSHALLQEGKDWQRAEQALRTVLRLDPGNAKARNNLALLLAHQEQRVVAVGGKS